MNHLINTSSLPGTTGRVACSTLTALPDRLALTALVWSADHDCTPADIRDLRCTLEQHTAGHHYALVHDVDETTAVWSRWPHDDMPDTLLVLPDCPASHPDLGGCGEFEGHPGGHTWELHDPWNPATARPPPGTPPRSRTTPLARFRARPQPIGRRISNAWTHREPRVAGHARDLTAPSTELPRSAFPPPYGGAGVEPAPLT